MTTSALLRYGVEHLRTLVDGVGEWLERHGGASVSQIRGSMSRQKAANPEAFERANYLRILQSHRSPYQA
jgi:dihydroorotate dehydrogenase (fumarate)